MSKLDIVSTMVATFNVDSLNEQGNAMGLPMDNITEPELKAGAILVSIQNAEHAVAVFHDLYQGRGTAEDIQNILNIAYPDCSERTASHHLCRFRNPDKYKPKTLPRYNVGTGRGGKVSGASVNLPKGMADKLAKLLGA